MRNKCFHKSQKTRRLEIQHFAARALAVTGNCRWTTVQDWAQPAESASIHSCQFEKFMPDFLR
jgi:hypothetical protein